MTSKENPRPAIDLAIATLERKSTSGDFITVVGTAEKTQDGKYYIVDVMPCLPGGVIQISVSEVNVTPLRKEKCNGSDEEIELFTIRMRRNSPIITLRRTSLTESVIASLHNNGMGMVNRLPSIASVEGLSSIHTMSVSVLVINTKSVAVGCYYIDNGHHLRALINPGAQAWVSFDTNYILIAVPGAGASENSAGWGAQILYQGIASTGQTITV